MNKISSRFVVGTALASMTVFAQACIAQSETDNRAVSIEMREYIQDNYIFVFKPGVDSADARGRANMLAAQANAKPQHVYKSAIKGFSAKMSPAAAQRLAANNPSIAYYEPDGLVFATMGKPGGGGSDLPPQTTPWGIARVNGGVDGTGLTAWVIDSGIDLDHEDLNVDTARAANFVSSGKNTPNDGNGHGTHVAGTIAAIDNGVGVVGVAAGATVVPVRVLDNRGSGSFSGVIAGIDYVAANGAPGDVANMSLGAVSARH